MKPHWLRLAALIALTMFLITACNPTPADTGPDNGGPVNGGPNDGDPDGDDPNGDDPNGDNPNGGDPDDGDPGDGSPGTSVTKLGLVLVGSRHSPADGTPHGGLDLMALFHEVAASDISDLLAPHLLPDDGICMLVGDDDDWDPGADLPDAEYGLPGTLAAGDPLRIERPGMDALKMSPLRVPDADTGSWVPLDGYYFYGYELYRSDLPAGTTLRIPGDEFPAFDEVALPVVPEHLQFTGQLASGTSFHSSQPITWTRGSADLTGTDVHDIILLSFTVNGSEDPEGACIVRDTGSLDISARTDQLGGPFTGELVAASRMHTRVQLHPDESAGAAVMVQAQAGTYFRDGD